MDVIKENVELIVEDRGEIVTLSIQDGAFTNNIDDKAGVGDKEFTWSADKLYKEFENVNTSIEEGLNEKVDKVDGMGLSEQSFTLEEKDKLSTISYNATENLPDSYLLNRENHTGVQDVETISGLSETLDDIEDIINSLLGDKDGLLEEVESIKEALSKTNVDVLATQKRVSDLEVKLSKHITYADNRMASLEQSDTIINNRIDVIYGKVENKVDKIAGKGLSTEDFTRAEKVKLANLESSKYRGQFKDMSSLPTTGGAGWYADVDGGVGKDVYRVIWDMSDNKWVRVTGESTALSDAQIKQQYENNPDTNAFRDSDKSKLSSIENGATKNRSDSENADKLHTHSLTDVVGLQGKLNELENSILDKVNTSDTSVQSSPDKVLRLDNNGMVDSSVLPEVEDVTLGFGLSEDTDGSIQLGKEIPNTQGIVHGVDLDELGDDTIFGIGREFDQYGLLTRGIAFYKGNTFLREGNARISVKQGNGTVEAGRSYSEDEVRMICSISLDSPISSVTTGDGRKFVIWDFDGSSGKSLMLIEDKKGYLFEQDFSKGSDSDYYHNARIVTLGYHKQKISELENKINTLESTLNKLMYSIYGR